MFTKELSWGYPPPPGLVESVIYERYKGKIFEKKGLIGKILSWLELGPKNRARCGRASLCGWGNFGIQWKDGRSVEHDGFSVAVKQDPVVDVPADSPRENDFF